MRPNEQFQCVRFPCVDVNHQGYAVPGMDLQPETISIVMIAESAPSDPKDNFYADGSPLFLQTTLQAFNDAGIQATSIHDVLNLGFYLTTAVKCAKTAYGIQTGTIRECSTLLEKELALFPNVQVFLLMGDVAIQAVNAIARRAGEGRPIPAGSTYKIRGGEYFFQGKRALPSYLQAGPSFFIEKSKRKMIAQDIAMAFSLVR